MKNYYHSQATVYLDRIATPYFQCNQDELFPKLKYLNFFIFHHPLIKGHLSERSLVMISYAAFLLRCQCFI
jgi:hypothetical protein